MKEIYCFQCRRYKRADLFGSDIVKNKAKCLSCNDTAKKQANKSKEEKELHHRTNVSNGRRYKKYIRPEDLRRITGENE